MEDDKYYINVGELGLFFVSFGRGRCVMVIGFVEFCLIVFDYDFCWLYVILSVIFVLIIFEVFFELFY